MLEGLATAASCVTAQHLAVSTNASAAGENHTISFPDPVSLRAPAGGPSGLLLDVAHVFTIVEAERGRLRRRWQATTRMYEHRLLDHDQEELLVYHWQPGPIFAGPDYPHLHVSAAMEARIDAVNRRKIGLDRLHAATGWVSCGVVVRMLITEFQVAPRRHDWREALDRAESVNQGDLIQRDEPGDRD